MANVVTNPRYWQLDTAATINAASVKTVIRKLVLYPAAVDNEAVIQEYVSGALVTCMRIKAGPSVALPVELDFGPKGRTLRGFRLDSITVSGVLDVYLEER